MTFIPLITAILGGIPKKKVQRKKPHDFYITFYPRSAAAWIDTFKGF